MIWEFRTPVGVFRIEPDSDGGWELYAGDECFGWYDSPDLAAGDVYGQCTGYDPWDDLDSGHPAVESAPDSVVGWDLVH